MSQKYDLAGYLRILLLGLVLLIPSVSNSATYDIDTSSAAPLSGLWWNELESGWGVTLTQQFDIIFVTLFTYDSNGTPTWYVASNCRVWADGCTGELYKISGGTIISSDWNSPSLSVDTVGSISFTFTDDDTGTLDVTIDGVSGSKMITRQMWSTLSPGAPMTALWWNELESGWGMTLTQQTNIAFATIFTYDTNGFPTWYIASNCAEADSTCNGELYSVTGGAPLTESWNADNLEVTPVGNIEVAVLSSNSATMSFDIDSILGLKSITQQIFALDDDEDGASNNMDAFPDDPLRSAFTSAELTDIAVSNLDDQSAVAVLTAYDKGYSLRQIVDSIKADTLSSAGDISGQTPALTSQNFLTALVVSYPVMARALTTDDDDWVDEATIRNQMTTIRFLDWMIEGYSVEQITLALVSREWKTSCEIDFDFICQREAEEALASVGNPVFNAQSNVIQVVTTDTGTGEESPQASGETWVYSGTGTYTFEFVNVALSGTCESETVPITLYLHPDGFVEFSYGLKFYPSGESWSYECNPETRDKRIGGWHVEGTFSVGYTDDPEAITGSYNSKTASGSGEYTIFGTFGDTYNTSKFSFSNLLRN